MTPVIVHRHPRHSAGLRIASAALVLALAGVVGPASAQARAEGPPGATDAAPAIVRDAWMDAVEADLDRYARRYPQAFDDELQRYQAAPRVLLDAFAADDWPPSRRYLACAIARLAARACRDVAQAWQASPEADWRQIATRHGLVPDAARARLRGDIRASYGRWGRALPPADAPAR